jgi:thioredoxin reductase
MLQPSFPFKSILLCCFTSTTARAMTTSSSSSSSPRIAVIGAGAAGLSAARVLSRGGINPVVLDKEEVSGGVWRYVENSKTRPMYRGLRTNLPKEVMQFREKPWNDVPESFVTHKDVLDYLQSYEKHFDLGKYVSYGSPVKQLTLLTDQTSRVSPSDEAWPKIRLEWENNDGSAESDVFDAVFICNGHYARPANPSIPGLEEYFKGETMHSVSYDDPKDCEGKTVLCIGGRASGADLAREISFCAEHVYLSDTGFKKSSDDGEETETVGKVTWVPKTVGVQKDGRIQFEGATITPDIDQIIFCSGYDYEFPFINEDSNFELSAVEGERRISPLFSQLWHARYPNLAFVGIPHSVVPFPLFEIQAEAVAAQFTNFALPGLEERLDQAKKASVSAGRAVDTHHLGGKQWEYCLELANIGGICDDETKAYIAASKVRCVF